VNGVLHVFLFRCPTPSTRTSPTILGSCNTIASWAGSSSMPWRAAQRCDWHSVLLLPWGCSLVS